MLEIVDLTLRVAGRTLIDQSSALIPEGHRVGLIGRNGTGKSTLLKTISGEIENDGGTIRLPRAARLGFVKQEAEATQKTPLELVLEADLERAELLERAEREPEHRGEIEARLFDIEAHAAPARAARILVGLGFDHDAQNRPMSSFSGGWRMRVSLAAALFARPDLLLLDEPTNHLDLEAALWLENFLKTWPGTMVLVSHDRDFLNSVVTGILHLEREKLTFYTGDYDTFERVRAEKLALNASMSAKQDAQRKHMQAFVDRFKAKASKARQAQSRMKALARLSPIEAAVREPEVTFRFPDPDELAPPLIALDQVSVGYDGKPILRKLDLRIDPDDRIALLGANGNGKTTLAKAIGGRMDLMDGNRVASGKMRVGYFAQHQVDDLALDETPIQAMSRLMPGSRPDQVRGRLAGFGLTHKKAETMIGRLSGGEKARLTLAMVTHHAPHLLILDEPTNHLDIDARDALVEALAGFAGAVILVSHDRRLVEMTADRLWLVANGTAQPFDGDMDDYTQFILGKGTAEARPQTAKAAPAATVPSQRPAGSTGPIKKQAREAEQQVAKLTAEREKLDADLADPKVYAYPGKVATVAKRRQEVAAALEEAEQRWLELAEQLERMSA